MAQGLNIDKLRSAVRDGRIEWQRHALERMVERGITRSEVKTVLLKGEQIEDYPEAYPLPAALFLGRSHQRPLHVVAAFDSGLATVFVVTVYEPTLERFEPGFRRRRKP